MKWLIYLLQEIFKLSDLNKKKLKNKNKILKDKLKNQKQKANNQQLWKENKGGDYVQTEFIYKIINYLV